MDQPKNKCRCRECSTCKAAQEKQGRAIAALDRIKERDRDRDRDGLIDQLQREIAEQDKRNQ